MEMKLAAENMAPLRTVVPPPIVKYTNLECGIYTEWGTDKERIAYIRRRE